VFAVCLQVVGDAAELLNFPQCAVQGLDVGLSAALTVGVSAVGNGVACILAVQVSGRIENQSRLGRVPIEAIEQYGVG
jgi:hypothetical protein